MKSAFAATVLAAAASSALGLQLTVKSSDASVDGLGVSSIHEGAAINYLFLGQGSETYIFDASINSIQNANMGLPAPAGLTVFSQLIPAGGANPVVPVVTFAPGVSPDVWTFDASGTLQLNGTSTGFFGCKNFDDPYDLSTSEYFVTFYGTATPPASEDCVALTIVESTNSTETSSAAASSAAATSAVASTAPATETSAAATAPAVSETNGAGKLTVGAAALVAAAAMLL